MQSTLRTLFFSLSFLLFVVRAFPQNFAPPVNYPTDTFPRAVVQGDFNHDGNADLIVANQQSNTLDVFLGHGDGTFSRASTISLGPNAPFALAAADFDGDGNLDLVVTFDLSDPQILFGNGDGTFRSPITIPLPSPFHGVQGNGFRIVAADFNGDGHPDIALTGSLLGILIFINDGNGTFSSQSLINTAGGVLDLVVGDFNNDGHPDIAFAANDGTVGSTSASILLSLGNGDGTFQPPTTLTTAQGLAIGGIAAADFNGDGRLDLIYTSGSLIVPGGALQVLLQQADGSFVAAAPTAVSQTLSRIIAADFNGDLNQDVAVLQSSLAFPGSNTPNQVLIFHGKGDGTFAAPTIFDLPNGNNPSVLGAIDLLASSFTGTGALDLAIVDSGPNEISVLVNQGANTLALSSSSNPANVAAPVTLMATVQPKFPGSGTLSGSVIFADGNKTLGIAPVNSSGLSALSTTFNTPGNHPLLAVFSGNSNFVGGSSASLTQVVNKATPPVTLTSSKNPSSFGEVVQFTGTVSAVRSGVTPTGSLNLMNGISIIASGTLDSTGRVVLTLSSLPVGANNLIAQYPGDANYAATNSPTLVQTVNKSSTSTGLDLSPNPSIFGQAVTLTATVAASGGGSGTPSGTVTFNDGGTVVGAATLDSTGKATVSVSSFAVGSHTVKASYAGDGSFLASTSPAGTQAVNKSPATATLTTSPTTSVFGQKVTLTASVVASGGGAGTPSGTVTFNDGATSLGSGTLDSNGKTSLTVTSLSVGTHSITAKYAGDNSFLDALPAAATQTVNQSPTATTLVTTPNPSAFGQTVTLTAAVAASGAGAGAPSGTVTFSDAGAALGTASVDKTGKATLSVSSLGVGTHNLSASYGGDGNFTPSSASGAGGVTQVVNQSATITTLSSSANPSVFGQPITFTAAVTASGGGAGTPGGTVIFAEGATSLGSVALDNTGKAMLTLSSLPVGGHTITASYSGNPSFLASNSSTLSQAVNKNSVVINLTSAPNPSAYGQSVTFSIQVAPAPPGGSPGAAGPTGSLNLMNGASVIASGTLDSTGRVILALSSLPVGGNNLIAQYAGDVNYALASSPPLVQTVNKSSTSTVLTLNPNPSVFGQAVTLTATVTPSGGGSGTPSGTVTFSDGSTVVGTTALDTTGKATVTVSSFTVGSHPIKASYPGDSNFLVSTSPAGTQAVNRSPTTATLTTSPTPTVFGQAVTLAASVVASGGGAGTPSGTVTFSDGATSLGSATLDSNGKTSLTVSSLSVGTHSITVKYAGDNSFLDSLSAAASQTVNKSPSSTGLAPTPNPSVFGQSVTLTATVTAAGGGAGTPSGTVSFTDGGTALGIVFLGKTGKATLSVSSLGVGTHNLSASYGGDDNFTPSSASGAGGVTQVVNQSTTITALSSSANPSVFGQPITFTAAVTASGGGAGTPAGTVTFTEGATSLGSGVLDSTGKAMLTLRSLAVGNHTITASYSGNASFLPSNSSTLSQAVNRNAVVIDLTSAPNPSTYGQNVTFSIQIAPAPPGGSLGLAIPTGTITFSDGVTVLGTATLDNTGKASFAVAALTAGSHNIVASYGGDANFSKGSSSPYLQEVDKAKTQVSLTSSMNPTTNASNIILSARVTSGAGIPSGNMVFLDGTAQLASVPLDGGGSASLPLSNLSIGDHNFTAVYGGDGNFATSPSPVVKETVVDSHSSVKLSSSANPQTVTEAVTLVASVMPALGGMATGGTVTFSDGRQPLGTVPLVNSTASFATNTLLVGDHSITAVYQAGAMPGPFDGVSPPLVETINSASPIVIIGGKPQDFTIAIQQSSSQIRAGETFSTQVTLTPVNGLIGAIATLCAGVPEGATCTVTPDLATLDGKNPIAATLAITTTAAGTLSAASLMRTLPLSRTPTALLAFGLLPLAICLCSVSSRKRKRPRLFALMLLAGLLAGCGGTKVVTKPPPANTPPGTYTITVQAQSGSVAHSSQIVLAVK